MNSIRQALFAAILGAGLAGTPTSAKDVVIHAGTLIDAFRSSTAAQ